MKVKLKKLIRFSPVSFVFIIAILLVIFYLVYILVGWNDYLAREAGSIAEKEAQQQATLIDTELSQLMANIEEVSSDFSASKSDNDFVLKMDIINDSLPFSYFRYFKDGKLYTQEGSEALKYEDTDNYIEASQVMAYNGTEEKAMSAVYTDKTDNKRCIAFYIPIFDCDLMNGFVGVYNVDKLDDLINYKDINSKAVGYSFSDLNGNIIFGNYSGSNINTYADNVFTFLTSYAGVETPELCEEQNQKVINDIKNLIDGYQIYDVDGKDYVFAYSILTVNDQSFMFSKMYLASNIADGSLNAPVDLIGVLIAASLVFIVMILYHLFINNKYSDYICRFADKDNMLGCSNYPKFQKDAAEIITKNKNTKFAVLYVNIRRYSYLKEHFGEEKSNNALMFISDTFKKFLTHNETYGHIYDDSFAVLLHFKDVNEMTNRFNIIYTIIYKFALDKAISYNVKLTAGIYCASEDSNLPITDMLDRAMDAQKINNLSAISKYTIYDDSFRTEFTKEAAIEAKMETALASDQFKVYLQPKLNLHTDKIDGAEALVRWEEADHKIIMPNDFIPLFERNGFVDKLDKYMYTVVCKYISDYVKAGERIVPISVNVSRVTAIQDDFLDFYINTKNKYAIADGFLVLEFTESFAYENYEVLRKLVNELRKNGILSSIDDFGSGYSSFNLLKEIKMDELKMDRLFLKEGIDSKRDDIMISTVINMAKDFGMKVTQEGIETAEEKERLIKLGCDVIQGYYYSRPMSKEDFGGYLRDLMMHYKS